MITNYEILYFSHPYLSYIFLSLIFLCVGSFLNVVIIRLPKMLQIDFEKNCHNFLKIPLNVELPNLNIISIPSHCVHCNVRIPLWNNIPVLSFFILRGKCAKCFGKISWRYPFVEILTAIFSLIVVYLFGYSLGLIYALLFIWIGICLCFIDINTKLLPDCLTISLLWLGLLANTNGLYTSLSDAVYGVIGGYLSLWIIIHLYYLFTGKVGMGGGDFKLFAALGAWFGLFALPEILIISSFLGLIFGAIYLLALRKSKNTPIPFGPFLVMAGIVFLFKPHLFKILQLTL